MQPSDRSQSADVALDSIAEQYVKIALALRPYDADYVDAYYGPEEWSAAASARSTPLDELTRQTSDLLAEAESIDVATSEPIVRARRDGLVKRLRSMRLRMAMAGGERRPFDEESTLLFDAAVPPVDLASYRAVLAQIEALVPGVGVLADRVDALREQFTIPVERLATVFDAAIAECRRRTLERIELPDAEGFRIEYVTDKPWSGYNWYEGRNHSLIQINTDLPIYIDRAIDLGCHEGYPGHHTYNVLTETQLVQARGWIEFALNPLFGPLSLISEGSANYGIELAFPGEERRAFERDVLFPLAGLDTRNLDAYYDLLANLRDLQGVEITIARAYVEGQMSHDDAVTAMQEFALSSAERAAQRLRFIDAYRSYIINYSFGRDLVAAYVEAEAGDDLAARWRVFEDLLSRPASPSALR